MDEDAQKLGKSRSVLICGGAGYIGSHMARMLAEGGHKVTVFDNLSTGHRQAAQWGDFVYGDLRNPESLDALFREREFDAVFHFSALIVVPESVRAPMKYYDNNVAGTFNLLKAMRNAGINRFVFSSTAAVYGNPVQDRINEAHPLAPLNPYGRSKLMVEEMLGDLALAHDFRSVSFRYFNAAGAHPDARIGEAHQPESHLIPNILTSVLDGGASLRVFGDRFPTSDGTCVRDYVHVLDLCSAHMEALEHMDEEGGAHVFNLGNGEGFTVLDVVRAAEEVIGREIPYVVEPAREGDSPALVADSSLAMRTLGWKPEYGDLREIIETAWRWHREKKY